MRRLLKGLGTALLFLAVALCFAPSLIPPFLDRIYYRGPPSDHFDGERFFNPGFGHYGGGNPRSFVNRVLTADGRAEWPSEVPVRQTVPPRRVNGSEMRVTWIGHATVLVQTGGLNILTDPIWSERASPFSFAGPKRVRAPGVKFEDLPKIDLVVISHNHYDHMDLPTLKRLWARDRPLIVTSLGNDTILRNAGMPPRATEYGPGVEALDWGQPTLISRHEDRTGGGPAYVVPLRNHHWGSRWGTDRNRALWSAFLIKLPGGDIFFAGDTGWGDGSWVKEAAAQGPYRLAIIPIGAYEPRDFMKTNHVNPEEAVHMFEMLRPTAALGIHWGTFQLTFEAINDPPSRLANLRRARGIPANGFLATEVGRTFSVPAR
ncbi:MAG TPA: MBL fold metallo-hydrolase [Allosphingosinicella sp.]|uniref:MBL fold metallo-hydrolase n=1 Tax=Allosphingosinicella sp. TaxID=2823234 RepID=UPI002EDB8523